jgi:hypothetical protein
MLAETPKVSREITSRIYLTGTRVPTGYSEKTAGWYSNLDIHTQTASSARQTHASAVTAGTHQTKPISTTAPNTG